MVFNRQAAVYASPAALEQLEEQLWAELAQRFEVKNVDGLLLAGDYWTGAFVEQERTSEETMVLLETLEGAGIREFHQLVTHTAEKETQ